MWNIDGHVYNRGVCFGPLVDVVRKAADIGQGCTLHCEYHQEPEIFQEPPLESLHVLFHQLARRCDWESGRLDVVWGRYRVDQHRGMW